MLCLKCLMAVLPNIRGHILPVNGRLQNRSCRVVRYEIGNITRYEIGNITPGGKDLKYRTKTKQDQQQNLKLKTSMFVYFKSKKL